MHFIVTTHLYIKIFLLQILLQYSLPIIYYKYIDNNFKYDTCMVIKNNMKLNLKNVIKIITFCYLPNNLICIINIY